MSTPNNISSMSKLSPTLKSLINASHARPGYVKAPPNIRDVYGKIANSARDRGVGMPAWLTISTAATMTMNSPDSMLELYNVASVQKSASYSPHQPLSPVQSASLMREVGLKCISFNGIPRTINMLGSFRSGLPKDITTSLSKDSTRDLSADSLNRRLEIGKGLWDSVYYPHEDKLIDKLADSHPDLPVHILNAHYGTLLADPPSSTGSEEGAIVRVGRVLTSLIAIACLRAQTGVGPQVLSHVFGLRKAFEDGTAEPDPTASGEATSSSTESGSESATTSDTKTTTDVESTGMSSHPAYGTPAQPQSNSTPPTTDSSSSSSTSSNEGPTAQVTGGAYLATDEGSVWILECVDTIVSAIGEAEFRGSTSFAPGYRAARGEERLKAKL